jgi:hypothetical protein
MAAWLSREVVTAGSPGHLVIFGRLTAGDTSANGMYAVSTATGQFNTPDGFDLLLPDDSTPLTRRPVRPDTVPSPDQHQGRAKT